MILYIAKRGQYNIGAVTHRNALRDLYGEENVYYIDLLPTSKGKDFNYISFGEKMSRADRYKRFFEGNIRYISNEIIDIICDIINKYKMNLVFTEESDLGNLMERIKVLQPSTKIICFYHDITADLFAQRRRRSSNPLYKLECSRTINQEKKSQSYVDKHWTFNISDSEKLNKFYNRYADAMIPLSTYPPEIKDFSISTGDKKKNILFVCSNYYPNINGMRWFFKEVYPDLKGDFGIIIVGTGSHLLSEYKYDNVSIIGKVDSLDSYYLNADICITPIFEGGGMKVKTLEAISYGKHIVGAVESMHGYWENIPEYLKEKIVFCSDSAEYWSMTINKLISIELQRCNKELYDVFLQKFSYKSMKEAFCKQLENI